MSLLESIEVLVFWCCVGGVVYAYAVYPGLVWGLSVLCGQRRTGTVSRAGELPSVELLIAAHNEEAVIGARIENAIAIDYPRDRFGVVVASDASDDKTVEISQRCGGSVRTLAFAQRRGKAGTLNAAMAHLSSEIVVLSDANTHMDPACVRNLVRWFADPDVGVVCGRLVLEDSRSGRNVDGMYWRYETFLKRCEAKLGALLGANGAIYAIRRSLLTPVPETLLVDDFVIPLRARLESGCRIVYDQDAIAREETAPDVASEFRRRARIGAGGFQALGLLWPLLHPRWGWTAFAFWSHKVLRWVGPVLLLGALVCSLALSHEPVYRELAIAQGAVYGLSAIVAMVPGRWRFVRVARVLPLFVGMNLALLAGLYRWVRGGQSGVWTRTPRARKAMMSS